MGHEDDSISISDSYTYMYTRRILTTASWSVDKTKRVHNYKNITQSKHSLFRRTN